MLEEGTKAGGDHRNLASHGVRSAAKTEVSESSRHRDTVGRSCSEPPFNSLVVKWSNILIMVIACPNSSLNSIANVSTKNIACNIR